MGRKNSKKSDKKPGGSRSSGSMRSYEGRLEITRSGMGFLVVEGLDGDVMVRPHDFNTAMHGDRVRVTASSGDGRRIHGEVQSVLVRKQTEFVGTLQLSRDGKGYAFFVPDGDKKMPDIYIPEAGLKGAGEGQRVVVKLVEWDKGSNKRPSGEVVELLNESKGDAAMKAILLENGFTLGFSDEAMEVAARIPESIPIEEVRKRKDFRDILTFTIDPVDAKDFDDALSVRLLADGNFEIGVHIADVSHYVEPGTSLDTEAYEKATSVYLPDRVSPMLPEEISNVLCSLRPHEDKLTFSAVFTMTPKGAVKSYWLGRTVIHSDHRFSYEEVQDIIDSGEGHLGDEVRLLHDLAQRLRKKRFEAGAINFSSTEVRFKLDEEGVPIDVVVKESKESHQLIEEFMLLANKYVAQHVSKVKVAKDSLPFPYRVHDLPSEEKLLPFVAFARKFGHKFNMSSPDAIATSFNQLMADVAGKPEEHVLQQLGIRTMAKAVYTIENIGHYGLGFEHYTHFTSPIRRYPDVLVHRILQEVLDNNLHPRKKLEEQCKHCSERERAAMESERAANKYKQVQFIQKFLGEEFDAVVSGVSGFGFWAETALHKCEGMISNASLSDYDDFRLVPEEYMLAGSRSGRTFRMGDHVRVKVIAANLDKRQIDFEWVGDADIKGSGEEGEKPKSKKRGERVKR